MTNWRPDFNPDHLYFATTSAVQYRHLFRRDVMKRLIVDSLDCMRLRNRFKLYAFVIVIMPNHVHIIIQCYAEDPLAACLRDLKKHIADRLIRHYRVEGNQSVLDFIASAVTHPDKQRYKVWEDGYDAKDIFSPEFLRQKMNYSHNNPCQPHWNLVEVLKTTFGPAPDSTCWRSQPSSRWIMLTIYWSETLDLAIQRERRWHDSPAGHRRRDGPAGAEDSRLAPRGSSDPRWCADGPTGQREAATDVSRRIWRSSESGGGVTVQRDR